MNTTLFILGSGILDHPSRWEILGMTITGILLAVVSCWTLYVCLFDLQLVENRNEKSLIGVVFILLLLSAFGFFSDRYNEIMYKRPEPTTKVPPYCVYTIVTDDFGRILIYENFDIEEY